MPIAATKQRDRLQSPIGLAVLLLLLLGLSACEEPPPEPGKPVLQIHGTKPPSIDLSLRLRYIATTEQRQCQKFTTRTMGYVPIEPAWHVWPHEPPSKKPDRRYRVVPMDTTGSLPDSLQGKNLEPFRWAVNAGWGGAPSGCDFKLTYITVFLRYFGEKNIEIPRYESKNEIGDEIIDIEEKKCSNYELNFDGGILRYGCTWRGLDNQKKSDNRIECNFIKENKDGYCLERPISDTVNTYLSIAYHNRNNE